MAADVGEGARVIEGTEHDIDDVGAAPGRGRWRGRLGLVALVVGVAAVTVVVPPLISPRPGTGPATQAGSGPAGSGAATSPVDTLSAGPTAPPTVPATATPGAGPTERPPSGGGAPAGTSRPTTPATSIPPVFRPITVEAEDRANDVRAPAEVTACDTCSGGYRVRYIGAVGQLSVHLLIPTAGLRKVTVVFETDGPRSIKIALNGSLLVTRAVDGVSWVTPRSFQFTAGLPAGAVVLTFYNDELPAPDIDQIVVS